jgi:aspartyl-tRNA(Asn)/glutamyl-tRNA(Gln) amidotransferase subunit C
MKVAEKDVVYVADLANLELTPQERARMVRDLNSILDHVDRLNELDTSGIEAMASVPTRFETNLPADGGELFPQATRDDIHEGLRKSLSHAEAIVNAPDADESFFRVPKVIER